MEWRHDVEAKDLDKASEAEISEALVVQERELEMEGYIRGAELKAMQERRMLNSLLDSVVDSVITIDPRGTITRFNNAAEKQFGWASKEVLDNGINIKEMMPLRFAVDHDDYLFNYLSTGVKKIIGSGRRAFGLHKDGSEFPIYVTVSEVIVDGFHLFTGIVRDLTEEVKKERMRQAEEDCLPQMIWKVSVDGQVETINKRFMAYTGASEASKHTVNLFSAEYVHKADYAESLAQFKAGCARKGSFDVKRRLKSADGTYRWFATRATPIFSADGSIKSWCGSCTDIDDAERLQNDFAILPESLPNAMWKVNLTGDVQFSNTKFQEYMGITSEDKVNAFSEDCVHPDEYAASLAALKNGIKSKAPFNVERRLKGADGQFNWFMTRGTPILDFDETVIGVYGTCTNINEMKEAQTELLALPDSLPLSVWKITPRGDVVYANKTFRNYVGAKEGDAINVFSDKVCTRALITHL
jgi:PAS domain S-box-containing protein